MRKEKKREVLEALRIAEITLRRLHPDKNDNEISDEAFSVLKHVDEARKLIDPRQETVLIGDNELKGESEEDDE